MTKAIRGDDPVARMKIKVLRLGKELGYVREMDGVYGVVFDQTKATAFDYLEVGVAMLAMQKPALVGAKPQPVSFNVISV